jgi:methylenetetrahydrofolate--tRNA-(uracil-5-)-methyltransferase
MVGATLAQILEGRAPVPLPFSTALGSLSRHVSEHSGHDYQPANVTFGLMDDADVPRVRDRGARREALVTNALGKVREWTGAALAAPAPSAR